MYSKEFVLAHPGATIDILINTVENDVGTWIKQATGWTYSGLSLFVPEYISLINIAVLMFLSICTRGDEGAVLNCREKGTVSIICILCLCLTLLVEMITWTSLNSAVVEGVQGRYFIPLMPLLMLLLGNKSITRERSTGNRMAITILLLIHIVTADHILLISLMD